MKYRITAKSKFLWPDLLICTLWCWAILGDRHAWSTPTEFMALIAVFLRIVTTFLLQKAEIRTWVPLGIISGCLGLLLTVSEFPGLDTLVRYPFIVNDVDLMEAPGLYTALSIGTAAWLWGVPVVIYLLKLWQRGLRKTELTWRDVFGSVLWKDAKARLFSGMLLVSMAALYAGMGMDARTCRFVCLAAPAASYWLLCRYYRVERPRVGWMIASMSVFYYAQVFAGSLRHWMLGISLGIVACLGWRMIRKNLRVGPLLVVILYIGMGLPSMSIGYNQYTGTEYARHLFGPLPAYNGIFLIKDQTDTLYGLRDRYGILVDPRYKNITPHQPYHTLRYQQLELKAEGHTDLYDLEKGKLYPNPGNAIPTEERIIIPQEDLRAYFDSLCRHTEARLWIHRQDDPDTMKVWEAIDELTLFAQGERMSYPTQKVQKALQLMGLEQAYLESHGGWQESTWNDEGPNPGELFLSHFLKKAAHYCPRMELLTPIHSEDKKVGIINFPSWGNQPFQAVLLYRDGKGLGTIPVTNGEFAHTKIVEITRMEDTRQNLYLLRATNDDTYVFDIDRKEFVSYRLSYPVEK